MTRSPNIKRLTGSQTVGKTQVRRMIRGTIQSLAESKVYTINTASTAASAAGLVIPITQGLIQGDNITQRAGDKITVTSVHVSAQFAANALLLQSTIRYMLLLDTMNTGAGPPGAADILDTVAVTGQLSPTNLLKGRFRILIDESFPLIVGGANQTTHFERMIKRRIPIFFGDIGNTSSSNARNAMFVLVLTDATLNQPSYQFAHQLRYLDM